MVEAIALGFAQLNLRCLLQPYHPFSLKLRQSQLSVKRDNTNGNIHLRI